MTPELRHNHRDERCDGHTGRVDVGMRLAGLGLGRTQGANGQPRSWVALTVYMLFAALFFGIPLLLQAKPAVLGVGADPEIFIWAFAWWPHAILHGQDPFVTHVIWAPDGTNLAWTTTVPGLALAFAPLTLTAGPVVSYDVAALLMPALAAWTAFLLCRHVTRSFWPSLAGGYVFGFSSYMLGAMEGHLHLTSVFLVPLVALVALRYVQGELGAKGAALRLGVLFALQLTFSSEVTLTLTLALLCSLVLAFVLVPEARPRVLSLLPVLGAAAVIAAALTSPLLYYMLSDFRSEAVNPGSPPTADLVNFVVPTDLVGIGHGWTDAVTRHYFSNRSEQAAYLGLPLIAILGWFAASSWRTRSGRFLIAAIAAAVVLSSGSWLVVLGRQVVTLPWEHIGYLPLFDNIYPARIALYVTLGIAVVVAGWASSEGVSWLVRTGVVILAVITLAPNPAADAWRSTPHVPPFIAQRVYERCLSPSDNVLVFPFGPHGDSMLWQADAGFRYRMAGAWIAPAPPSSFTHPPGVADIAVYGAVQDDDAGPVRDYVRIKHVTVIVLDPGVRDIVSWQRILRKIHKPVSIGGVLVYRFRGSPPGRCTD